MRSIAFVSIGSDRMGYTDNFISWRQHRFLGSNINAGLKFFARPLLHGEKGLP